MGNLIEPIIDEYRNLELTEDFDNEEEENEKLKNQLESLKGWLKLLDNQYEFLKLNGDFDNEDEKD